MANFDMSDPIRNRPTPDFRESPFLVIWETTRACDLACVHCRAEAIPDRDPRELSTLEAMRMLNEIRRFGNPLVVLSGGDPFRRDDIADLVEHGSRLGLRMALTPSGTPLVTSERLEQLRDAGLSRVAVSLDGASPGIHDAFRGVEGSFAWTRTILKAARALGISTQVNTTVTRCNLPDLDNLIELMKTLDIALWSVFFLVPMGRARPEDLTTAEDFEAVFRELHRLAAVAPFDIKTTAAPHYRRFVLQQRKLARRRARTRAAAGFAPDDLSSAIRDSESDDAAALTLRMPAVNDGDGFLFVSHVGEIFPSGFLPVAAGDVRRDDVVEVYRHSPLFERLRDRSLLKGKCGVCEYRTVCGGSRARAYALTGDYLEADPSCVHVPARYRELVRSGEAEPLDVYFRRRVRRPLPVMSVPANTTSPEHCNLLNPERRQQ